MQKARSRKKKQQKSGKIVHLGLCTIVRFSTVLSSLNAHDESPFARKRRLSKWMRVRWAALFLNLTVAASLPGSVEDLKQNCERQDFCVFLCCHNCFIATGQQFEVQSRRAIVHGMLVIWKGTNSAIGISASLQLGSNTSSDFGFEILSRTVIWQAKAMLCERDK